MSPPGAPGRAPRWFELSVVAAATSLGAVGSIGLLLAIVGSFRADVALVAGLGVAAVLTRLVAGSDVGDPDGHVEVPRSSHVGAALAMALACSFFLAAAWAPSQHVTINRDPGSYVSTARWLARDGSLEAPAATGGLDDEGLGFRSFAVYEANGRVQFQFNHLTSVVLAVAYGVGGQRAMFRLPAFAAAVALLALYAVAVRTVARPFVALVAPTVLAVCMPFVFVARDAYSESIVVALLWTGVLAAMRALDSDRAVSWVVPGVLLGAAVATRTDSLLYVAVSILLWGMLSAAQREAVPRRNALRNGAVFLGAAVPGITLSIIDLVGRSGGYLDQHSGEFARMALLVVGAAGLSAVAVAVAWWCPRVGRAVARCRRSAAPVIAAASATLFLLAWIVRPHVQTARGADEVPLVGALQAAAGQIVEADRRYGELTMTWVSWYFGAVGLSMAIAGVAILVYRVVRGGAPRSMLAVLGVLAAGGVYLWRPFITPDQVWAMRRFVPSVLPALSVAAAVSVAFVADRMHRGGPVRSVVVAGLAAILIAGPAVVTWPVRQLREQHGSLQVVEEACELIGEDASVVVVGRPAGDVLPQTLRSWCGVPVGVLRRDLDVGSLSRSVSEQGRTLVLVGDSDDALRTVSGAGTISVTSRATETQQSERTLLRPPSAYRDPGAGLQIHVLRQDGVEAG